MSLLLRITKNGYPCLFFLLLFEIKTCEFFKLEILLKVKLDNIQISFL